MPKTEQPVTVLTEDVPVSHWIEWKDAAGVCPCGAQLHRGDHVAVLEDGTEVCADCIDF
ncbi:hypothetical protein AB0K04_28575 [Micromonospora coxensis]|uniref:hypothetical protein n=1 Tax=Micromonospora coxensis TaxID=356852 RepID=UPI0034361579